jgi:hypothetical protein
MVQAFNRRVFTAGSWVRRQEILFGVCGTRKWHWDGLLPEEFVFPMSDIMSSMSHIYCIPRGRTMGPRPSERFRCKKSNGREEEKSNADIFQFFIFLLATVISDVHIYRPVCICSRDMRYHSSIQGSELGECVNNSSMYLRTVYT